MRVYSQSKDLEVATKEHVCFAFNTVIAHLSEHELPAPDFPDADTALFVTWKISPTNGIDHARLRGCIGVLEPRRLHVALRDYALTSALRDSRFSPIRLKEIPTLECTVSLLSCFEPGRSWEDWEVGTHGLIIEFTDPEVRCRRSATFLPEVAHEQGWTKQECIDALIRKSGYSGRVKHELREALQLTRYQSTTCTLTYNEYLQETNKQVLVAA
mmetsp:Transcript_12791/g.27680  ORF Transcript_12791/g.27680 Transcript_12791/m.27680 type:complete len:214 (-) Transcript_12791:761-1402(-)